MSESARLPEIDNMAKAVTFGGKIHLCLKSFDQGEREPLEVVIAQLKDTELDFRKLHKLILEVIISTKI